MSDFLERSDDTAPREVPSNYFIPPLFLANEWPHTAEQRALWAASRFGVPPAMVLSLTRGQRVRGRWHRRARRISDAWEMLRGKHDCYDHVESDW